MCFICRQLKSQKLTLDETIENYNGMKKILNKDHQKEIDKIIHKILWKDYKHWSIKVR
jgi:hypothetical protein